MFSFYLISLFLVLITPITAPVTGGQGIKPKVSRLKGIYRIGPHNIDVISIRDYSPNSRIDDMLAAISSIKDIEHKNVVFVIPNIKEYELDNLKQKYSYIQFYGRLPHEMIIDFKIHTMFYIFTFIAQQFFPSIKSNTVWIVRKVCKFWINQSTATDDMNRIFFMEFTS